MSWLIDLSTRTEAILSMYCVAYIFVFRGSVCNKYLKGRQGASSKQANSSVAEYGRIWQVMWVH